MVAGYPNQRAERIVGIEAIPLNAHRTGVGNYLSGLLKPLCRRHVQTTFFLYSNSDIHFPPLPNVICKVEGVGRQGTLWRNTTLPRLLARDRVDTWWATNCLLPVWGLGEIVKVLTVHDLVDRFAPGTQKPLVRLNRRLVQSYSARRADYLLAVSTQTALDMQRFYGRSADDVIHPLVSTEYRRLVGSDIERIRQKLELPDRFWLVVGTLEPRKNLIALIRAYLQCRSRSGTLPLLVLAGGGGWLSSEIEADVAMAVSSGAVRRLGFVPQEDMPGLYGACEVLLMPSLYEGFGMPVLEAQLCGAPVLHGDHGSMVEAGGGLGVTMGPSCDEIGAVLSALARGEAPIACRLPTDPMMQTPALALRKLEKALGLTAADATRHPVD